MGSVRRRILPALAAVALGLSLTACSGSGGKKAEEGGQVGGGNAANTPRIKVAMVTHAAAGDTFWDIVQKGAQAAAQKDNAKLLYSNSDDASQQAQLVETAINQDVDGIVVTLAKPEAMKSAVQKAVDKGIPVVTINSGSAQSKAYGALAHFGQEESIAGEAAGDELTKLGMKKVVCVIHEQGNVGLEQRCAGAKKTFDGDLQNLQVTGKDMTDVQSKIQAKLQSDKSIDGILTLGAPFATTAVQSAKDAGSDAKVATFDMDKKLVTPIKNKEIQFAVDQQPYLQGYMSVDEIWLYLNNGNVIGGGQTVLTGPQIVTSKEIDKVSEYAKRGTR